MTWAKEFIGDSMDFAVDPRSENALPPEESMAAPGESLAIVKKMVRFGTAQTLYLVRRYRH